MEAPSPPTLPPRPPETSFIHIEGAREHNLKNVSVRLPRGKLTVITGVSGSGKSSLAFDTLYAEGYRKYMDSLSTRARALLEQVKRPEVDFIHGLSPVIAIEQRESAGANPRSTLASVTEIADYARLLWSVLAEARCPRDGGRVARRSIDEAIDRLLALPAGTRCLLCAPVLSGKAAVVRDELPRLRQRGFQRVRLNGVVELLDSGVEIIPRGAKEIALEVVVDRLVLAPDQRGRLADSLELAFREGRDRALALLQAPGAPKDGPWTETVLSQHFACEICGTVYEPLTPRHFSWNHPEGACPDCGGLGRQLRFAPALVVPDPTKSVKSGAIKPWRIGGKAAIIQRNALLKQLAAQLPFDPEAPWQTLPEATRHALLHGTGDERRFAFKLKARSAPVEQPWGGVLADLDQTRKTTRSDGLRARLLAYQTPGPCPGCAGARLGPYARAALLGGQSCAWFFQQTVTEALAFLDTLAPQVPAATARNTVGEALGGLRARLHFLAEVGLGYLALDREYGTLSGGEAQRARLATQLGMGLVGVAYVLDEPSIGLHPSDNAKLIATLCELRDRGNAVVVVEHDADMMRAADHLVELGPGAGAQGGHLLFQGSYAAMLGDARSRTGPYLSGADRLRRQAPAKRPGRQWLTVKGARMHNLQGVTARFPVGLLTVVTGVSGSGKSSLVNDILGASAALRLHGAKAIPGPHDGLDGLEHFEGVVRVDQEPIGRSPRSNPATFTKALDLLRDLYAETPLAKVRGYGPARFSFNARGGRCERCQGDGAIALDMQFLADAYAPCPSCGGARYNRETLEVRFKGLNIAEALALTVDDALTVFKAVPRLADKLRTLQEVGLGYLRLGQPAPTLSGGEAQRLKLSLELSRRTHGGTLYLLDEPTTGLHFLDIQHLLDLLFRLRDAGHTLILIEHHPDVIRLADWVLDLGPGGGRHGGRLLFAGPPDELKSAPESVTAKWV